jgi:transcription initiation factor TFIIIB Brf1 subunit/transcription initiation factor TFIIB
MRKFCENCKKVVDVFSSEGEVYCSLCGSVLEQEVSLLREFTLNDDKDLQNRHDATIDSHNFLTNTTRFKWIEFEQKGSREKSWEEFLKSFPFSSVFPPTISEVILREKKRLKYFGELILSFFQEKRKLKELFLAITILWLRYELGYFITTQELKNEDLDINYVNKMVGRLSQTFNLKTTGTLLVKILNNRLTLEPEFYQKHLYLYPIDKILEQHLDKFINISTTKGALRMLEKIVKEQYQKQD